MTYGVTWGEGQGVSATEDVSAATIAFVGSDQTDDSGSFVAIADLSFPVVGGASYVIEANLIYNTSAVTEGCDFGLTGLSGLMNVSVAVEITTAASSRSYGVVTAMDTGISPTGGPGATSRPAHLTGTVSAPPAGGTLSIAMKAETGNPESVTVKTGSYATLRRLS